MRQEVPNAIQTTLKQKLYPRIISLHIPIAQKVVLNSFNVLKYPSSKEREEVVFNKPDFIALPEDPTALVQIIGAQYGNPQKMIEKGLFQPIKLNAVDKTGITISIPNPLIENRLNSSVGQSV